MTTNTTVDYSKDIEYLTDLITHTQTSVYFIIGTTIGLITLAVGLSGWALRVINANAVNKAIRNKTSELDSIIQKLKEENQHLKERINNKVESYYGIGNPEGVVTAKMGSIYINRDGEKGETAFIKEVGVGNTGWRKI